MAEIEEKVILSVDTANAGLSIGELRAKYKQLKAEVEGMRTTDEQYATSLNQLRAAQADLRDAMKLTATQVKTLDADVSTAGKSYNELQRTLTALTQAYKNTHDEAERNNLANQILPLQQQLKELDARIGNHQRNVGNYTQSIVAAFGSVGGAARGMVAPIGQVDMALKALSANPVMATIGILASAIALVAKNLKTSEDNMRAMSEAMSAFQAIGDIATRGMQAFGKALTFVVDKISKLVEKYLPQLAKESEERAKITEQQIALEDAQREATMRNAEDELKVAELRNKATQKSLYNAEQRIGFLREAADLEKAQMERNVNIAQQEYDLLLAESKRTGNSKEMNDKLAQAYANVYKAQTEYFTGTRRLTSQLEAAIKEEQAANPILAANKALLEDTAKTLSNLNDEIDQLIYAGIADELAAEAEANKALNTELDSRLDKINKATAYETEYAKVVGKSQEEIYAITLRGNEQRLELLQQYGEEALAAGDPMTYLQLQEEAYDLEKEMRLNALAETIRIEDEKTKKEEEEWKKRMSLVQNYAGAVSGVMNSIADIMASNSRNDVQAAEKAKAVRIASATIDTIAGAVGAYMQTVKNVPPPTGIPLAIANAAVVTAAGLANIAKIKAQNIGDAASGGEGGAAFGGATAPQMDMSIPQMAMMTGASNEAILNQMRRDQKVYILSSDLQAEGRRVEVQQAETTFA